MFLLNIWGYQMVFDYDLKNKAYVLDLQFNIYSKESVCIAKFLNSHYWYSILNTINKGVQFSLMWSEFGRKQVWCCNKFLSKKVINIFIICVIHYNAHWN